MKQISEIIEEKNNFQMSGKGRFAIFVIALAGLGGLVYPETLLDLFTSVLNREGSSHGFFVPFFSGYFIWVSRHRIRRIEPCFSLLPGVVMVAASFILLLLPRGNTKFVLPELSFILAIAGLALLIFGTRLFKEIGFPILFLITMIPIPRIYYDQIAEIMRQISTSGSVMLIQLLNIPLYRNGYYIHLPNANLLVAMGCSGIRYLLSYFVFSIAYAYLFKKSIRSRVLVILASLPIAAVAGILRLFFVYLTVYYIGAFMAEYRPHVIVSWFVFVMVLAVAVLADQALSRSYEAKRIKSRDET